MAAFARRTPEDRSTIDPAEYDRNRGRAQAILILAEEYLPAAEPAFLQELIDHDEFGLALDCMLSDLGDNGAPLPTGLVEELREVAHLMYPGESIHERLARLDSLIDSE